MINDEANNYYCFAVKSFSELNPSEWLACRKAATTNDNDFGNALNDALNYQNTETHPERISKIKPDIRKCNWEGIEFLQTEFLITNEENRSYKEPDIRKCNWEGIEFLGTEFLLTNEENRSYEEQEACQYAKKSFVRMKMMKVVKIEERLKITVITQENLKEPPTAFEI